MTRLRSIWSRVPRPLAAVLVVALGLAAIPAAAPPAAAAAVGPGGVSGARAWLRADVGAFRDAGVTVAADGDAVQQWTNTGAIGDVSQATAGDRPIFRAGSSTKATNFNPVIDFVSQDHLDFPNDGGFGGTNPFTFSTVTKTQAWGTIMAPLSGATGDLILTVGPPLIGTVNQSTIAQLPTDADGRPRATTATRNGNTFSIATNAGTPATGTSTANFPSSVRQIGAQPSNTSISLVGQIPEYAIFNRALTTTEQRQIESYYAAKYGLTLDQTTAQNYLASDGTTTMWNATTAGAYKNNITVIGRDDASDLSQKQSLAQTANGMVTMALGSTIGISNAALTSTFGADRTCQTISDDNGAVGSWTTTDTVSWRPRIAREWQVQETGTVGNVTLSVPASTSTATDKLPASGQPVVLLVDADGDFTTGATAVPMTLVGTDYRVITDLAPGSYVTFATVNPPPAAVAPDLDGASDTGSSSTDDVTNDATPTFTVTCTAGLEAQLRIDGTVTGSAPCVGGTASITSTALSDGAHSASVTHSDPVAGGSGTASPTLALVVDTTVPTATSAPDMSAASDTGTSSTDDATTEPSPVFAVACTTGDLATLLIDGVPGNIATCVAGSASMSAGPPLTNGTHSVAWRATDLAGNTSAASPALTIVVDATIPAAPAVAPDLVAASDTGPSTTDDVTNDTTPTLTLSGCTVGRSVTVYDGATPVGLGSCTTGTIDVTTTALADGTHQLRWTERTVPGIESAASPALAVVVDTAAPSTPLTTPDLQAGSDSGASTSDDLTQSTSLNVDVVCSFGDLVTVVVDGVVGPTSACAVGVHTVNVTVAEGTHTFRWTNTDLAGNVSSTSPTLTVTVDTTAPATPATAPDLDTASDTGTSNTDDITNDTTPTFTVSGCVDGDTVTLLASAVVAGTAPCVGGTASVTAAPALADGPRLVRWTATDPAGNTGGASPPGSIIIVTTPPAAPTTPARLAPGSDTGVSDTDGVTSDATPTVEVTCTTGQTVTLWIDGLAAGTAPCVSGAATLTAAALGDGAHAVTWTTTNDIGNTSAPSPALTITVDATAPTALAAPDLVAGSDTGASDTDDLTGDTTPTLRATGCTDGDTIAFQVDGTPSAASATCAAGTAAVTLPAGEALSDGPHTVTVSATDPAGNVGAAGPGLVVTVDTTAPTAPTGAPTLDPASDGGTADGVTNDTTPTVTVACTTGDTVTVLVDGVAAGTALCVGGTASITVSPALADGTHALRWTTADPAGNTSAASPALTVTVDTMAPAAPSSAPTLDPASDGGTADGVTNDTTPTVTVACTTGDTVSVLVDGVAAGTALCVGGTASVTVSPALTEGTHLITTTVTDPGGNTSPPSPALAVTVDTMAPAAPTGAPTLDPASDGGAPGDGLTNDPTPTVTVACTTGDTVTVLVDGVAAGSALCVGGTASVTVSPALTNGAHTITTTVTDPGGNTSPPSPALTLTVSVATPTAPGVPTAGNPPETAPGVRATADPTPTLTLAPCTDGELVTVYDGPPATGTVVGSARCSGGSATLTTTPLADGTHPITWTVTDPAGNVTVTNPGYTLTVSADADGDGIPDAVEGTWDGNGDGIPDATQAGVVTVANPTTGGSSTLATDTAGCAFTSAKALEPAATPAEDGYRRPVGLFEYRIRCATVGVTQKVTFHLHGTTDTTGWSARKLRNGTYSAYAATFGTATGPNPHATMTVTVTDGGTGDDDGVADGTVTDPIGPAVSTAAATTTTATTTTAATTTTTDPTAVPRSLAFTGGTVGLGAAGLALIVGGLAVGGAAARGRRRRSRLA